MNKIFAAAVASLLLSTSAMAEDLAFYLTNLTSADIQEFYVSQTGTNQWEENLLAGYYLPSGNEIEVMIADGLSVCEYDIKAVFSDGDTFEDYGLDLCDLGSYTFE